MVTAPSWVTVVRGGPDSVNPVGRPEMVMVTASTVVEVEHAGAGPAGGQLLPMAVDVTVFVRTLSPPPMARTE